MHWSSTPKAIAMTFAEVELYAATRAMSELMDSKPFGQGFGKNLGICVLVDAHATTRLRQCPGLGKARLAFSEIWRR